MEELKRIILEGTVKDDGRLYLNFKYFQDDKIMSDLEVVGLLTASLSRHTLKGQRTSTFKKSAEHRLFATA